MFFVDGLRSEGNFHDIKAHLAKSVDHALPGAGVNENGIGFFFGHFYRNAVSQCHVVKLPDNNRLKGNEPSALKDDRGIGSEAGNVNAIDERSAHVFALSIELIGRGTNIVNRNKTIVLSGREVAEKLLPVLVLRHFYLERCQLLFVNDMSLLNGIKHRDPVRITFAHEVQSLIV